MRFDNVPFDDEAKNLHAELKEKFEEIETLLTRVPEGRAKSLVLTKLEESFMWVGKAFKDAIVLKQRS